MRTPTRCRALVAILAVASVLFLSPAPAVADIGGYTVTGTGGQGLKVRADPYDATTQPVSVLADGTPFSAVCAVRGRDVFGNNVWHRISVPVQGWIADFYTTTPGFNQYLPGEPECYHRTTARDWAYAHYLDDERFPGNDCTWFVSQALWAGQVPRTSAWTDQPAPTVPAVRADALKNTVVQAGYATIREVGWTDVTAGGAQVGDLIAYDWAGAPDGVIDHLAIVTSLDAQGAPSVTQHSLARKDRYWSWDPGENKPISASHPGSRVYLIHVTR
ncbi:amidase domain-containing protein [Actinoplanes sp. NPDC051343]|uniref:amidase domain-containing protein n=1 Tax=Actinoplanes sp. NPDC051343 TaxID=3363906 RepID=UPI0037953411